MIINLKRLLIFLAFEIFLITSISFAQGSDIDFTLDVTGKTRTTPNLLRKPGIDLSGRGFRIDPTWPQNLASPGALDFLEKKLNLQGRVFRLQFDLWEFVQLAKNKQMQAKFLDNHSQVIKNINAAGGIVILNLYGMPPGLGEVLDKKSSPWDIKAFKELVKDIIRFLSCEKGYDIWYEVWNAPDLEDFFIGQKQKYFNIYQAVAEGIIELKKETNRDIPVGGPGTSWWFRNIDDNTALNPEKSLIYELIRFCSQRKLPLDFISWHAYTSDPFAEGEMTCYKKAVPELIREWLSYFGMDSTTPIVISEWNYDAGLNFDPKRGWESYVAASFIPSRLRNMLKSGIDYQTFFSLEDFKNNKEGVNQNVGLFWFEPEYENYTGGAKSTFNVIRMLNMLGSEMFLISRLDTEFVGIIATRTKSGLALLLFNYIDPHIARNYLSRYLAELHPKRAKALANLVNSPKWEELKNKQVSLKSLRLNKRVKAKIEEALALKERADSARQHPCTVNLNLINLKGDYVYAKYVVDKTCRLDCEFTPREEKQIMADGIYKETLMLEPYSVVLLLLEPRQEAEIPAPPEAAVEGAQAVAPESQKEADGQNVNEQKKGENKR